ncbi:unnamed protein product [Heterosigma akashiwo]|mmetsp:Transcript_58052/g.84921  ORF Transcript_58052/g.84921 Transcript_58052/m.84921 type:complete len:83 (-) Transcript_58052:401-649(-)
MSSAEKKTSNTPSEFIFSETWDKCLERGVINIGLGLAVGAASSLVLFKSGGMRKAVTFFGAGCGAGASWTLCSLDFKKASPK